MAPEIRTQYNIDAEANSDATGLLCNDPSLTQQQFKDSSDINVLFGKYLETGEIPQVEDGLTYGNFEGIFDFQTAMNAVRTAEGLFNELPARIKNRFDNDPQKLLEFVNDPENREEAEFLKIVNRPETQNGPASQSTPTGRTDPSQGSTGASGGAAAPQGAQGPQPQAASPGGTGATPQGR